MCTFKVWQVNGLSPKDRGFPFQADFETTFEIHPGEDGIDLTVDQVGFPNDPAGIRNQLGTQARNPGVHLITQARNGGFLVTG